MDEDPPEIGRSQLMAMIEAIQARMAGIDLPVWPVYGIAGGEIGFLSGVGEAPDGVATVRLDYRRPDSAERLIVQTQLGVAPVDLGVVLAKVRIDEDGEPLDLVRASRVVEGDAVEVIVDGAPAPARMPRDTDATVCAIDANGVAVVVAARNVELASIAVERVRDLAPYKTERVRVVDALLRDRFPDGMT